MNSKIESPRKKQNQSSIKLQRLNMDNSWCLEFAGQTILIDPWLKGVEIDFFSWFNTQWHKTQPVPPAEVPEFDLVLITQKYPDHYHPETLVELQPKKIIVPQSIEKSVKKVLPKASILTFNQSPKKVMGTDINLHFLPTSRKMDPIYDALLLENGEESILIATHGYTELKEWTQHIQQLPPVSLAFTPFNKYQLPFFLGGTVSPGLDAVKALIQALNPGKIVATHDEDKHAKGIVHKFARITFPPDNQKLIQQDIFKNRLLEINDYSTYTI